MEDRGQKFVPPYRVGRNQGRVILDSLGHEVGIFRAGSEEEAQKYCDYLNDGTKMFDQFKKQFEESFSKVQPVDFIAKMMELGYVFEGVPFEEPNELSVEDYKEVIEDHKRLVRELDVILNGKNAAKQASLCDIVSQVKGENKFNPEKWTEFIEWIATEDEWRFYPEDKIWKMDGWGSRTTIQLFELYHKKH